MAQGNQIDQRNQMNPMNPSGEREWSVLLAGPRTGLSSLFGLSRSSGWLIGKPKKPENQINETNQRNQTDQTNQIDQMNQPRVSHVSRERNYGGCRRSFFRPTPLPENSASGQPRHSGGTGVSLRLVAVDHAVRKDSRPLCILLDAVTYFNDLRLHILH